MRSLFEVVWALLLTLLMLLRCGIPFLLHLLLLLLISDLLKLLAWSEVEVVYDVGYICHTLTTTIAAAARSHFTTLSLFELDMALWSLLGS